MSDPSYRTHAALRNRAPAAVLAVLLGILAVILAAFPLAASQPASASLGATGNPVTFNGSALGGTSPEAYERVVNRLRHNRAQPLSLFRPKDDEVLAAIRAAQAPQ